LGWIGEPVVSVLIENLMRLLGIEISADLAHDIALPVAFAIITILHIVFGELAPKSVAIQRSEQTTLIIAYPLRLFYIIFKPFIWFLNGIANIILKILGLRAVHGAEVHSSDELKYLVHQGKETGMIEPADYNIIKNAFDFSQKNVRLAMVPRTQVLAINVNDFSDAILEKVIEENYSRIPCYEDSIDNIIGVVYLKDILMKIRKREEINIREIMRPVMIIPETKHIGQLLKNFQAKHQQIAIVVDEYGSTKGIITMEDILEELVGQIQDEYHIETPIVEKTGSKTFKVVSLATVKDINELLPHPIEEKDNYDTLAGFLITKFKRIPDTNDRIISNDYEFTVLRKNGSMITLVQVNDLKE
jgi:CBS domain containing-hemolysin-like protein